MEDIFEKKRRKERKKKLIQIKARRKKRGERKKNRVKEDVVESRGETWVKKREHANGADKEGSAQERQARARQYRGFRGTERNRMGRRIRRNDIRRPVPKFHEGGPAGFSCSVRVPRSARASFLVSFTRSSFRPGIRAGITDIPFIRFAWILAFNNTE